MNKKRINRKTVKKMERDLKVAIYSTFKFFSKMEISSFIKLFLHMLKATLPDIDPLDLSKENNTFNIHNRFCLQFCFSMLNSGVIRTVGFSKTAKWVSDAYDIYCFNLADKIIKNKSFL